MTNRSETMIPLPTAHLEMARGDSRRAPVVLLLAGTMSPITYMHLRLLEVARDSLQHAGRQVVGGYISPVADCYGKRGMVSAEHRLNMAKLAVRDLDWVVVDEWEAKQGRFVRTYQVVQRVKNGVEELGWGSVDVYLVCGGDLLESMSDENKWPIESVEKLFGVAFVAWGEREGDKAGKGEIGGGLERFRDRLFEIRGVVWKMSSSLVRNCVARGESILYMTPKDVVDYIQENGLFV